MSNIMFASSPSQVLFMQTPDSRRPRVAYPLMNTVVIAACAVICGADDFIAIAEFGRKKREWFAKFLDLQDGIPSHDRFNAIFAAIKPAEFMKCLLSWITALDEIADGQVVTSDGQALRRSFQLASSKAAIHQVNAWATANHMRLGQVDLDAEDHEIEAIPRLLEILELSGSITTVDAMTCQPVIARKIVDAGGNYIVAVKENQSVLYGGIASHFDDHLRDDFARTRVRRYESEETDYGQQKTRWHYVCPVPFTLPERTAWPGLKAIGMVVGDTQRDGIDCDQRRYYILSDDLSARCFADAVWDHWSIENRPPWQLDVISQDGYCRIRKGHADANVGLLRRAAFSMLNNESTLKIGIKNKRLTAGWDEAYLEKVLLG